MSRIQLHRTQMDWKSNDLIDQDHASFETMPEAEDRILRTMGKEVDVERKEREVVDKSSGRQEIIIRQSRMNGKVIMRSKKDKERKGENRGRFMLKIIMMRDDRLSS